MSRNCCKYAASCAGATAICIEHSLKSLESAGSIDNGCLRIRSEDPGIFTVDVDALAVEINVVPDDVSMTVGLNGCSSEIFMIFVPTANIISVTCSRFFSTPLLPEVHPGWIGVAQRIVSDICVKIEPLRVC